MVSTSLASFYVRKREDRPEIPEERIAWHSGAYLSVGSVIGVTPHAGDLGMEALGRRKARQHENEYLP